MLPPQFIIHPAPPVASREVLDAFRKVPTSLISDNMQRLAGIAGLTRFGPASRMAGTAFTVKTRPGDNLLLYRALKDMSPGHVLVVEGGGNLDNALAGELMMLYARERGCAGFVLDAAIRDAAAFREADFPCYARGATHRGPYKHGPGCINVPVGIAGQVVNPGDVVVADEDGLVNFAAEDAAELLEAVARTAAYEEAIRAEIANGRREQAWLDKVLAAHGL
jgi:RraA family protein